MSDIMNREIKFRGKCSPQSKYKGEWVTGSLVVPEQIKDNEVLILVAHSDNCKTTYHVDKDTIGQFTGLYDKNGKEIYEGDIVLHKTYHGEKSCVVRFECGAFIVGYHEGISTKRTPMLINKSCVLIGNIHDNPELIKEEQQ